MAFTCTQVEKQLLEHNRKMVGQQHLGRADRHLSDRALFDLPRKSPPGT
jgi:hypothetical protein